MEDEGEMTREGAEEKDEGELSDSGDEEVDEQRLLESLGTVEELNTTALTEKLLGEQQEQKAASSSTSSTAPQRTAGIDGLLEVTEAIRSGQLTYHEQLMKEEAKGEGEHRDEEEVQAVIEKSRVKKPVVDKKPKKAQKRKHPKKEKSDDEWTPEVGEDEEMEGWEEDKDAAEEKVRDDGIDKEFIVRIGRMAAEEELRRHEAGKVGAEEEEEVVTVKDDLQVAASAWETLFPHQRTGVRFLHELNVDATGGILADEMGLGKTAQVLVYLRALASSNHHSPGTRYSGLGPVLVVTPATILEQWVKECRRWIPQARASILHHTGAAFEGDEEKITDRHFSTVLKRCAAPIKSGAIVLTTYETFVRHEKALMNVQWHYVVCDEGHKLKNPNIKASMALKTVDTVHRLILTGTPLQNSLKELWSLIDFVAPGRLGTQKSFMDKFEHPIVKGSFERANDAAKQLAETQLALLRSAIAPLILRRLKLDVLKLPKKKEQLLLCQLSVEQRERYEAFLRSETVRKVLGGQELPFAALTRLRKICNHVDLDRQHTPKDYGASRRSGKLIVAKKLLKHWRKLPGTKVLLYTQGVKMLDILEELCKKKEYRFLRMDGSTAISSRQQLVRKFNTDPNIFVFLLTTKVGGLGLNLVGANRVIIFEPDWNPASDSQARERAWRLGQRRDVHVYHLLTAGTIEARIFERQIYKAFLTANVLSGRRINGQMPKSELRDLFTLKDDRSSNSHLYDHPGLKEEGQHATRISAKYYANPVKREKRKKSRVEEGLEEIPALVDQVEVDEEARQRSEQNILDHILRKGVSKVDHGMLTPAEKKAEAAEFQRVIASAKRVGELLQVRHSDFLSSLSHSAGERKKMSVDELSEEGRMVRMAERIRDFLLKKTYKTTNKEDIIEAAKAGDSEQRWPHALLQVLCTRTKKGAYKLNDEF